MSKTLFPSSPRAAERFMAVVVFPTPPFWLIMAIILVSFTSWPTFSLLSSLSFSIDNESRREERADKPAAASWSFVEGDGWDREADSLITLFMFLRRLRLSLEPKACLQCNKRYGTFQKLTYPVWIQDAMMFHVKHHAHSLKGFFWARPTRRGSFKAGLRTFR